MKPKPAKTLQQHLLFLIIKNESNQKTKTMTTKQPIKKPLYPKHYIRLDEDTNLFRLVFDGLDGVPIPYKLRLSEIGAEIIQTALCNMPVFVSNREFWGYKDCPSDEKLALDCGDKTGYYPKINCNEGTIYVTLDSHDEMALVALANVLSDARCWKDASTKEKKSRSNQKTKTKPLFPTYTMYFNEEEETYNLEFDGLHEGTASLSNNVLYPSDLVLTDIGAIQLKYALCNLPIHKTFGEFWGYKDQPDDANLWNCELPAENDVLVQLSSKDEAALLAVAKHLSDTKCWKISSYE